MTLCFLPNTGKAHGLFRALTLSLLFAVITCIPSAADPVVQITQCGTVITQPGHYILANDLNCGPVAPTPSRPDPATVTPWQQMQNPFAGSGPQAPTPNPPSCDCGILILSDHVDLALDGHTISGDFNFLSFGIGVGFPFSSSGNSHVHITGPGTVTNWFAGVVLSRDSFSSVSEVTADTNGTGFLDIAGFKNAFDGNTATNNVFSSELSGGISLLQTVDDSVRNNIVNGNVFGITVLAGIGNDIRFNTVTNSVFVGIGIRVGSDNSIFHNTAQDTGSGFDLEDDNANCDSDVWMHNTFGTANQSCIN